VNRYTLGLVALASSAALVLVLAGASTWGDNYDAPNLPQELVIKNAPSGGYVPVELRFKATPTTDALADGARPAYWTEQGRLTNANALACYNAIELLVDDERPVVFSQPLTKVDAGP
jgi:hypothetical protein